MAPQSANPPSLPPTVEEAYRRKCVQLKQRTKEIEDENDAYRLRLARLKRQIQKSRLERAFLLEQISRRTSANVEDSEGSPSPPPTPQDKPLRTKRAHRKPSLLPTGEGGNNPNATFISQNLTTLSPSSDAYSHSQLDSQKDHQSGGGRGAGASNGVAKPSKRPSNAFEIYCKDMRPVLQAKHKEKIAAGEFRLEEELARGWKDLPEKEKEEFQARYEQKLHQWREEREAFRRSTKEAAAAARDRSRGRDSNVGASRRAGGGEAASRSARFEDSIQGDDDDHDIEMAEADLPSGRGASATAGDPDQYETEVEDNDGPVDD